MNMLMRDKQRFFFISVFIACGVFLIWKAPYGYIFNDEPFMITLGHRLLKGDKLFVDEWSLAQTTGFVYAPFIRLFTALTGSMEGIVLFLRYVYVAWWLFTGLILYRRLKQYGWVSIIATVFFLLFTPLDEMSLTYNAVALSCTVLFSSYFLVNGSNVFDYINGLPLAIAVLVYPYLIILYFFYALGVLLFNFTRLRTNKFASLRIFDKRLFLRSSIVAVVIAAGVLVFILSPGLNNVVDSIKTIFSFRGGSKHSVVAFFKMFFDYFPIQSIGGGIIILISLIDKNRCKRRVLYFGLQCVFYIVSIICTIVDIFTFNTIMFPVVFLGAQSFILNENKKYELFFSLSVPGLIYAVCAYCSSDTKIAAFCTGITVTNLASIIFISEFLSETYLLYNKNYLKRIIVVVSVIVFSFQIGGLAFLRVSRTYWDSLYLFRKLNTSISCGVAKGIITKENTANKYELVYNDVVAVKKQISADDGFLSLSIFPSIYLDMNTKYATFSSWTFSENKKNYELVNKKMKTYYEINPEKTASTIYISYDDIDCNNHIDFVDLKNYKAVQMKSGIFYFRNEG